MCTKSIVTRVEAELSVESTLDMIAATRAVMISPRTPTGSRSNIRVGKMRSELAARAG